MSARRAIQKESLEETEKESGGPKSAKSERLKFALGT